MSETIGVFGGTFDPPHLGHLILAAESASQLGLDRVLWVLTPEPPHKPDRNITALTHRIGMLRCNISDNPKFELSTVEIDRPGPHYTIDTIQILQKQYPSARLVALIGGDSLRDIPSWHRPAELIDSVHSFGVMRRPDDAVDLDGLEKILPRITGKVSFVLTPQLEISSSTIRKRILENGHFRYYLHPAVYDYVLKNRLYLPITGKS